MAVPLTSSAEATYATKVNIKFPGTSGQATAAEAAAEAEVNSRLPNGVEISVPSGAIQVAT